MSVRRTRSGEGHPADVHVTNGVDVSTLFDNGAPLTVKRLPIVASAGGNNQIVAAVTSKCIVVIAYNFMANGTVNAKWRSASTDISGRAFLIANTGKVAPWNPNGWLKTVAGEALNLNLSAGIEVEGEVVYVETD